MTQTAPLPQARTPGRYRVVLVCLGNICRSPMADVVLESLVEDAGLAGRVEVISAGTAGWHVGKPMDRRAAAVLTGHGYDASRHRAQQVHPSWLRDCDLVLAMDADNLADLLDLVDGSDGREGDPPRVRMFRDFDPLADDGDRDVPDPYYGADEGFDQVLRMVQRTGRSIVEQLTGTLA